MQITVELFSLFRMFSEGEHYVTLEVPGEARVRDVLRVLSDRHGYKFERTLFPRGGDMLANEVNILLNGKNISLAQGLDTPLSHLDQMALLVTITGG